MEEKIRKSYPSDMTDEQWEEIAPLYTALLPFVLIRKSSAISPISTINITTYPK
jgi:hypothetical protein